MTQAIYLISELNGNRYCKTNGQFTKHLRANNLTYQDYYETYVSKITPLCNCGSPLSFYQKTETYANSCGEPKCVGNTIHKVKSSWTTEQRQLDSVNKQAAAAIRTNEQKQEQLNKARTTFREKYGVEWGSSLESQKEKSRQTKLEKYGDEYYNNRAAISAVNLAKSVEEKNEINEKRRQTNLEKYGVVNSLMKPEIRAKSAKSNSMGKEYTLPSGKIIRIRGHENLALDILFNSLYLEEHIIHDSANCVSFPLFTYVAVNRHIMKYYPDIYIPHENRIIEVKSRWWWDGNGGAKYASRLENNLRKRQVVIAAGYNYEVWIFTSKNKYKILKNDSDF